MIAAKLDALIQAVCPIYGVSIGRIDDRLTWRIDCKDEATPAQRDAAVAMLVTFVPIITSDDLAVSAIDALDRLQFTHLFDLENRVRALEAKAPITVAVYRQALIDKWKTLNA